MAMVYGVSPEQIARYEAAEAARDAVMKEISDTALAGIGLKRGDIVEDMSNGYHYCLDWCSVSIVRGAVVIHISGRRYWKTGRKAGRQAHSPSFLTYSSIKKVEARADG